MRKFAAGILAAAMLIGGIASAHAEEVARVGVDWIGNDIVIDAVADPMVEGVTCHVAFFDRSIIDRLQQGNWFEDPSNSSIDCVQTGPITIAKIDLDKNGEEVFRERRSIIFKTLVINRIYDANNNALVYLAHSRQIQQGSAKMSISVVPLDGQSVNWTEGAPQKRVVPVK
jgi:CreA protein